MDTERRSNWEEYERLVLKELERLSGGQDNIYRLIGEYKKESTDQITANRTEIVLLKSKVSLIAITVGFIAGFLPQLVKAVLGIISKMVAN